RFKQLEEKLNFPLEILLAFYAEINREVRINAEKPDVKINPLYKNLFKNIAVTNPLDDNFRGVADDDSLVNLVSTITLIGPNPGNYTPVPTIGSALAI